MWLPALWAGVLIAATLLGSRATETVVGASIGWFVLPAILKAWSSRDVSGISPGTW